MLLITRRNSLNLICRPIPDKEYVEAYVKAFYLPENILEEWIIAHKVLYDDICSPLSN